MMGFTGRFSTVLLLAAFLWMLPMKRPEGFKSDHAA